MAPDAAGKAIIKLWDDGEKYRKRQRAIEKVNKLRRQGVTGIWLVKDPDKHQWTAYAPPGTMKQVPAINKAARLCRLLAAAMFVDQPEPEATPSSDTDEDRESAEFATRVLQDLGAEGYLETSLTARQAFDFASVYGRGFRRYYTDPQGGGVQPVDVLCASVIQSVDQLKNPDDSPGPGTDPTTGQVYPPPYVTKWVKNDGTLTDDKDDPDVKRRPMPRLKVEVLKGNQVRLLPSSARDIWQARGALIGAFVPLGDLRANPQFRLPTDLAELKQLVSQRSLHAEETLPMAGKRIIDEQEVTDDALIWTVTCYYQQKVGGSYPDGFYGIAAGDGTLLYRGPWNDDAHPENLLDIPIDEFDQWMEEDGPIGLMDIVGPGNEIRAAMLGFQLEHIDRFGNRKVFYSPNAMYQPRIAQAATGTYVMTAPGTEPRTEQIPEVPNFVHETFDTIGAEMEHDSGLEEPITGQNPTNVDSAIHARTILEQVNVGLSDVRNNTIRGLTRGWRIQLQLVKRDYTVPQRLGWVGDDGAYKEKEWTGSDLGATKDVRLSAGSLSMLSPTAKASLAQQMAQMTAVPGGILTTEELRRIAVGNVGGMLGLQDDPHRQRIRRQIGQWVEGPPEGWQPPAPPPDPNAPTLPGAPAPLLPQAPQAPDILATIWASEPNDDEPTVAAARHLELVRLISSTRYSRWPDAWKAPVIAEYQRMRQAAQVQSIPELQQQIQTLTQQGQIAAQKAQAMSTKPNLSFSIPCTPLDGAQTAAIVQDAGIQLPPSAAPVPPASGDVALQQVGELHQGVQKAVQDIHQKIDRVAQSKAQEGNGKSSAPITIVNPDQETKGLLTKLTDTTAAHQAQVASMSGDLEAVKHLAANTALTMQHNPHAVVETTVVRGPDGKLAEIHAHHADGTVTKHLVQAVKGKLAGTVRG